MDIQKTTIVNICKICGSNTILLDDSQIKVTYSVCDQCGFIYKNMEHHLNLELELKEYKFHNNSFESLGYVSMFEDLIEEFIKPQNISGKALDFGSGPGPVLKELLKRSGFLVFDYDPFFNPNDSYLENKYNLITVTEVAEHFFDPLKEFRLLKSLLDESGYLVIMTKLNPDNSDDFLKSGYRRERTHVSFYALETIQYIAKLFNLEVITHNKKNIVVLKNKK
jgi:hypothetical protein